ncbi:MAG: winged helix-turn-helix transcriptional regulator [Deltaproteobacteria bacterium]|nr:winged helix-turn-helix transcriptional regulator [Deltaproteobacteria bacterium]
MVKYSAPQLDGLFSALSDSTRRAMLLQLASGECTVSQLAEPHNQTFAGISKHLKVLEEAGLVEKVKRGREISCNANLQPLSEISALLEELGAHWRGRLEALEAFLGHPSLKGETEYERKRKKPKRSSKKGSVSRKRKSV